jgi:hypothetical protein
MPNVYHVSSPSASLFSSTQQAGWYSTGFSYKVNLFGNPFDKNPKYLFLTVSESSHPSLK